MRVFDYKSFVDLSQVFDFRKGRVVPPRPKARVTLYATTVIRAKLPQSIFIDLGGLIPEIKPLFSTLSARKNMLEAESALPGQAEEAPKRARPILKLKTKVELPALLTTIARHSTSQDLSAVFKAEMALIEKIELQGLREKPMLESAPAKRQRHPLSDKSWSELLAEAEAAEAAKVSKKSFDLAAAFKAEMKAFMAEQEKMADAAAPARLKATFEPKIVSPQPQIPPRYHYSVAKSRVLAA